MTPAPRSDPPPDPETLFHEALELQPGERAALLDARCAGDPALRHRVERLLAAHDRGLDSFLETPPVAVMAADTEELPERIGHYEVLAKLGEGGCGVVYLARQTRPVRREVAVKVMRLGLNSRQVEARFDAERQVLAMMDHPHIATVYDAGVTDDGRPYFVMERVEGVPLLDYCAREALDTPARVRLFASICQAIEHAHRRGIIHRDLKPSNILVSTVDGEALPKVIDFGVAKAMGASATEMTLVTETGQLMGTPQYMSPEQCAGRPDAIDTRSDVYSLGVVLYEVLTGRLPYDLKGTHFYEIPRVVREEPAKRPSSFDRLLRGDLETILLRSLEKDRERRYASVEHLRADLERYLNKQPIEARRDSTWYVVRKTISRHRVVAVVIAAFVGLVTGSAVGLSVLYLRSEHHRGLAESRKEVAETQRALAERNHADARFRAYVAGISAADSALMADDASTALRHLEQAPEDLRDWEWHHLMSQVDQSVATLQGHTDAVGSVAWSPDGGCVASSSADLTVRIWSVGSDECLRVLRGHTDSIFGVAYSPDGRLLASGSRDHTVRLWDAETGALRQTFRHSERVVSVAFSPDGKLLAATGKFGNGGASGNLAVWDYESSEPSPGLPRHFASPIHGAVFNPTGTRLLVYGARVATLLDVATGEAVFDFRGIADVTSAVFSPDGSRIAMGVGDATVRFWSAPTLSGSAVPTSVTPELTVSDRVAQTRSP